MSEAGRKLDERVARVLGLRVLDQWHICWISPDDGRLDFAGDVAGADEMFDAAKHPVYVPEGLDGDDLWQCEPVPCYSTDITAAFQLMDKLREKYTNVSLHASNEWGLTCWYIGREGIESSVVGPINADTAAEAICYTFLEAFGPSEAKID